MNEKKKIKQLNTQIEMNKYGARRERITNFSIHESEIRRRWQTLHLIGC